MVVMVPHGAVLMVDGIAKLRFIVCISENICKKMTIFRPNYTSRIQIAAILTIFVKNKIVSTSISREYIIVSSIFLELISFDWNHAHG